MGTVAASIIAKNVGISRTSVRYTCENLIKKGLMIGAQK
jgi:DNA-binding Lrp family transcriptional regulator